MPTGDYYPNAWGYQSNNTTWITTSNITPTVTSGTYVLQPVQPVMAPSPEDDLTWLRRRVAEVCETSGIAA